MAMNRRATYSSRPSLAARSAHARGDKMFRTYDTSAIEPKHRRKGPSGFATVLIILVVIGLVVGAIFFLKGCEEDANLLPEGQTVEVVIPEGAGAQSIAAKLKDANLIADKNAFVKRVAALGADTQLKPGTYVFKGGMSTDEIIQQLKTGPAQMGTPLVIPEGYTIKSIAARVATATEGRVTADAFIEAASDASKYASTFTFLADAGSSSLEGFLFPKTYYVDSKSTADSIIRTMLEQYQKEVSALDLKYAQDKGLSAYDVLKLASIVEKESTASTRGKVASVFYNRLGIDMALQSDATTAYEVGGDPTAEQVHADTPYSTYTNKGLPPTPICSPGLAALQAVCAPEETSYFYFFFKEEDGEMKYYFSETNDEHNAAVFS